MNSDKTKTTKKHLNAQLHTYVHKMRPVFVRCNKFIYHFQRNIVFFIKKHAYLTVTCAKEVTLVLTLCRLVCLSYCMSVS